MMSCFKFSVRNTTLAFFNQKLNACEAVVESVLEDMKKLKSVGTQPEVVRDQVDLIKVKKSFNPHHCIK